ncbi:MAG: nicotinamide-nucleotide adenylyltransferase [Candidatus Thorarchaeota archaeon]
MRQPGLFIGRFQPFHKGHLHALKEILAQEEQVFIVIGSAQASHTPTNPFSTAERIIMLQLILEELDIPCSRYLLIPVPDIHNYELWVDHVKRFVPPFGIVYGGLKTSLELFSEKKLPVKEITPHKKNIYSGTEVRRRMKQEEDWRSLIPDVIIEFIKEVDGVRRVKSFNY